MRPKSSKPKMTAEKVVKDIRRKTRRHGLDPSQVYAWRKVLRQKFEDRQLKDRGLPLPSAAPETATFGHLLEASACSVLLMDRQVLKKDFADVLCGLVRAIIDSTFPFERLANAFGHLQSGGHVGKICSDI